MARERIHPPEIVPVSRGRLSITYNDQGPLGLPPLAAVRLVAYGEVAGGAGAGKVATGRTGLGRLVPETIVPDTVSGVAAVESSVSATLVMELAPPLFAISSMFCPAGEANSISTSEG